jgi:hypothetical protein
MKSELQKRVRGEEVIATFGEARLVRVEGRIELHGGSMSDRMEALEWMALTLPDEMVDIHR